jgi:hypothetical protein
MTYNEIADLPNAQQLDQLRAKEKKLRALGGRGEE